MFAPRQRRQGKRRDRRGGGIHEVVMRIFLSIRLLMVFFAGIVATVMVVGYGTWLLVREGRRAAYGSKFNPHMSEYLQTPEPLPTGAPPPVVQGGFLPINLDRRGVDDLYLDLPKSMQPGSPEEVKTVVWVRLK